MTAPTNYPTPALNPSILFDIDVNAPVYHHRAIARLTAGLYPLFRSGAIAFEPLPETMVSEYGSHGYAINSATVAWLRLLLFRWCWGWI